MRAAFDRGDLDEATRQGSLAGPATIATALTATARSTQLAAIASAPTAAPQFAARADLLDLLAATAAGPDRRTALPAASAARAIARSYAGALPDDLSAEDLELWRLTWAELANHRDRWIELRILALDTAAALDPAGLGIDTTAALADPDPAFRRAALAVIPAPVPAALRPVVARAVLDPDPDVALAAADALCGDLASDPPAAILAALPPTALARIRALAPATSKSPAARCSRLRSRTP